MIGAQFFWGAASEGYDRLWDPHLLFDLGFPPFGLAPVVGFGLLSLAGTIVVVVTAQVVRRNAKRLDAHSLPRVLVGIQVVRIGGRVVFALAPVLPLALAGSFVERMVRGSFAPLFNAWLIRQTDDDVRATVLSTTSVSNALGQVVGGPISGAIGNLFGIPLALLSSAFMLVPAVGFLARATSGRRAAADRVTTPEASVTE